MPTNKMGQALLDPESLTEPKQKRNFSGRPIPEYNSQGPSRPASVLGNYAVAPDDFSTQKITVDDDLEFTASGRLETQWGRQLHTLLLILTLGLYHLACRWFVHVEINIKTKSCALKSASHVVIVNQANELGYERVMTLDFNGLASSVFTVPACEQDFKMSRLYCFEYRYFRFILNPFTGSFEPNYAWSDPLLETVEALLNGSRVLSEAQIEERTAIFGSNEMEIREKSTLGLLFDEVLHPFFVFQIVSIVLWCLDHYYYYATCIFIISALSAGSTLMETKNNIFQMRSLSKLSCQVRIWRNRCWSYGKSEDMVPGDIFELESGLITVLPCDAVLLEGDCIVNESMLTGESLPVSKTPIPNTALQTMDFAAEEPASSPRMALYFLFSGTRIIRVRPYIPSTGNAEFTPSSSKRGAIALVVRTGFNTAKGNLVRNMLFPRPNNFKFYQDSFRFVAVLAMISGIGFLGSVYNFISLGVDWQTILLRALDLITIAVPPALPATMAIGTSFAIVRLRKGEIFCTSPSIVNICGKLNIMCFDKTGTLTEEGLDVLGIRFTVPSESRIEDAFGELKPGVLQRFSRLYRNVFDVLPKPFTIPSANSNIDVAYSASLRGPAIATSMASIFVSKEPTNPTAELDFPYPLIVCAMAACHSIKVVHGQHVGDPLDLKMFEFTGWFLEEDNVSYTRKPARIMAVRPPWVPSYDAVSAVGHISDDETYTELEVIKLYEFVSQLRRMSVISRRHCYPTTFEEPGFRNWDILCKGAPEAMRAICVPETCDLLLI